MRCCRFDNRVTVGGARVSVRVESPDAGVAGTATSVPPHLIQIVDSHDGKYVVTYMLVHPGEWRVHVALNGVTMPRSPFTCTLSVSFPCDSDQRHSDCASIGPCACSYSICCSLPVRCQVPPYHTQLSGRRTADPHSDSHFESVLPATRDSGCGCSSEEREEGQKGQEGQEEVVWCGMLLC